MTLSQSYKALSSIADQLCKEYTKSSDPTLKQSADRYQTITTELNSFSDLVKNNLTQYDKEIKNSSALISDAAIADCLSCVATILALNAPFTSVCFLCQISLGVRMLTGVGFLLALGLCGAYILNMATSAWTCYNCANYLACFKRRYKSGKHLFFF